MLTRVQKLCLAISGRATAGRYPAQAICLNGCLPAPNDLYRCPKPAIVHSRLRHKSSNGVARHGHSQLPECRQDLECERGSRGVR